MEEEIINRYLELEKEYESLYKDKSPEELYPIEFGDITNYSDRIMLLEKALRRKQTLYELDEMVFLHNLRLEKIINDNISDTPKTSM